MMLKKIAWTQKRTYILISSLCFLAIWPVLLFIADDFLIGDVLLKRDEEIRLLVVHTATITYSISTFIIMIALLIQQSQLNHMKATQRANYNRHVLDEIKYFFLSSEMKEVRSECCLIRSDLNDKNSSCFNDMKTFFEMQLSNNWGNRVQYNELQKTPEFERYAKLTVLLRWFDMIAYYDFDEQTGGAFSFYYYWWRPTLLKISILVEDVAIELNHAGHVVMLPQFVNTVKMLDKKLSSFNDLYVRK